MMLLESETMMNQLLTLDCHQMGGVPEVPSTTVTYKTTPSEVFR